MSWLSEAAQLVKPKVIGALLRLVALVLAALAGEAVEPLEAASRLFGS